ncbi:MAG TPA: magnesium transporter CorA family protein [Bryobacteraceae bacterium]|nr:magnesium transporter CorA family protein [Bryobacteraceae bacterium]
MDWLDLRDPDDPRLPELAEKYKLHPLHLEDVRNRNQSAKAEPLNEYLFIVLKPVELRGDRTLSIADLDFFLGPDWLITVQEESCAAVTFALDKLEGIRASLRPDEVFYRVMDSIVDSYHPIIDNVSDEINELEDLALENPTPDVLSAIFDLKRVLMQLRRILANTRDVVGQLLRNDAGLIKPDLMPFLRDVYDHLMRNLDLIEINRDLLNGATELYLSSVANRTNQVMKGMTILGTIATPALVITGMYGMNLKSLPFAEAQHSWSIVLGIIGLASVTMLVILKRLKML